MLFPSFGLAKCQCGSVLFTVTKELIVSTHSFLRSDRASIIWFLLDNVELILLRSTKGQFDSAHFFESLVTFLIRFTNAHIVVGVVVALFTDHVVGTFWSNWHSALRVQVDVACRLDSA